MPPLITPLLLLILSHKINLNFHMNFFKDLNTVIIVFIVFSFLCQARLFHFSSYVIISRPFVILTNLLNEISSRLWQKLRVSHPVCILPKNRTTILFWVDIWQLNDYIFLSQWSMKLKKMLSGISRKVPYVSDSWHVYFLLFPSSSSFLPRMGMWQLKF